MVYYHVSKGLIEGGLTARECSPPSQKDPTKYGKPEGFWFAPGFEWVDAMSYADISDVKDRSAAKLKYPFKRKYYDRVFNSKDFPNADTPGAAALPPTDYVYTLDLANLTSDLAAPDKTKVFHLKKETLDAFMEQFYTDHATARLFKILNEKNAIPSVLWEKPDYARIAGSYNGREFNAFLESKGLPTANILENRERSRGLIAYATRAAVADLLAAHGIDTVDLKAAKTMLPMSDGAFCSLGFVPAIFERKEGKKPDLPKSTPAAICSTGDVTYEQLEKSKGYVKKPNWEEIIAPSWYDMAKLDDATKKSLTYGLYTGQDDAGLHNRVVGLLLGEYYAKMCAVWGGVYFDPDLFETKPPESWLFYLEVPSGCIFHPEAVKDFKLAATLAYANTREDADKLGDRVYVAKPVGADVEFWVTPSQGGYRGRTFRRKAKRMNKNGRGPTRKSLRSRNRNA